MADHPEQDLGHVTDIPVLLAISYFTVMECSTVTDPSTVSTTSKTIQQKTQYATVLDPHSLCPFIIVNASKSLHN